MVSAGTLRGTKLTWIRIACMVLLSIALKANSTNHEQGNARFISYCMHAVLRTQSCIYINVTAIVAIG